MKSDVADAKINANDADVHLTEFYQSIRDVRNDFRNANLYQLVVDHLAGKTLLDVGAGAGHFVSIAQENGFAAKGIEPSTKLMSLGKEFYKDIDIICSTAEGFTIEKRFDNITMLDVVEHVGDDRRLLSHYKQYLNPDSRMVIIVSAHQALYGQRDVDIGHYRRYSRKQLMDLVQKSGLEIFSIRHWNAIGFLPYYVSEKILNKPLNPQIRKSAGQKGSAALIARFLHTWIKHVENNLDFHFGLSLICLAKNK